MESLKGAGADPERGRSDDEKSSEESTPLTPPALRRRWLTKLRAEQDSHSKIKQTQSDIFTMSDNASTPKAKPFTIWTRRADLITYAAPNPFTVWTIKPTGTGSSPAAAEASGGEKITVTANNAFTVWACTALKGEKITVTANNAFTVWAGTASKPVVVAGSATPVATPVTVASIFADDDEDDEEAEVKPVSGALLKWFAVPLVVLLGLIGFYQLNKEVDELTDDKNGLISEKTTLIGEKESLTGALDSEKKVTSDLTQKNRSLDTQLIQTQVANKSLENQALVLKKEIGTLKNDVAKLKGDLANAITRHTEEKKMLNGTIATHLATIAARDEAIKGHVATIGVRDKSIADLNANIKTADGRISELTAKSNLLSAEMTSSLKKASDLTAMLTTANKQLEASMAETKASAEQLRAELMSMKAQAETLTKEKAASDNVAAEMTKKASAAEAATAAALAEQKKAEAIAAEMTKKAAAAEAAAAEMKKAAETATSTPAPAAANSQSLFNGNDLSGWEGDARLWSVADGSIVGETNDTDKMITANTFLIWKGGEVADFELTLKAKITGNNNSGVQYRSKVIDPATFVVGGYQMDMHPKAEYFGMLYEEKGRGIVAQRGQKVNITGTGEKNVVGEVDNSKVLNIAEWNDYKIVAKGNQITHYVNGDVTIELVDDQESARSMNGVLAFQVHAGPAMKVEIKDVQLNSL
jgi:hypothetical protein